MITLVLNVRLAITSGIMQLDVAISAVKHLIQDQIPASSFIQSQVLLLEPAQFVPLDANFARIPHQNATNAKILTTYWMIKPLAQLPLPVLYAHTVVSQLPDVEQMIKLVSQHALLSSIFLSVEPIQHLIQLLLTRQLPLLTPC